MIDLSDIQLIPLALSVFLAIHGWRKKSLSPTGALAAFAIGLSTMSVPVRTFGVSLIVFYLVGSRATKVGKNLKAQLEEGHQEAGYRSPAQVFCNSCSAFVASQLWSASFVQNSFAADFLPGIFVIPGQAYDAERWCPLSPDVASGWSRFLVFIALGHFACCLGDTLASELGILSKSAPFLITSFKRVPPGTNGGMSVTGTLASLAGGFIMGLTLIISLFIENSACRQRWSTELLPLLLWGTLAGGLGSLLDSILGATIQETRQSSKTSRIVPDEVASAFSSDLKVISGIDILTNNQVNLVTSIITAFALARMAS